MPEINCSESSNLHWARYADETETLELDFKNAAGVKVSTYEYRGFKGEDWNHFQAAESKGRHFAYTIRPLYDKGGARYGLARKLPLAKPAQGSPA